MAIITALWCASAGRAGGAAPASRPAADGPPDPQEIARAVRRLGDDSYRIREAAGEFLWRAGRAAEPALRRALDSSDAEIVARARDILEKFRYGIYPDTPAEVLALIERFRTANLSARQEIIQQLLRRGGAAVDTALALMEARDRPADRAPLRRVVAKEAGSVVAALLTDRRYAQARRVLRLCGEATGGSAARDFAAFLLVGGGLDAAVADYAARKELTPGAARVLAMLHRARGDLAAAADAARRADDPALLERILHEQGAWAQLAQRRAGRTPRTSIEQLGYLAAYHRLAGNRSGLEAVLKAIAGWGRRPSAGGEAFYAWYAAEAMLLNDRPAEAAAMLRAHHSPQRAAEILALLDRYDEALALLSGKGVTAGQRVYVLIDRAKLLWRLGRRDEARRQLAELTRETLRALRDAREAGGDEQARKRRFGWLIGLVGARRDLGRMTEAAAAVESALPLADDQRERSRLVRAAFGASRRDRAEAWWQVLRHLEPGAEPAAALKTIDGLLSGRVPAAKAAAWVDRVLSGRGGARPPLHHRRDVLAALAETCTARGLAERAVRCRRGVLEAGARPAGESADDDWAALANALADKKAWTDAAACYRKAWDLDGDRPAALYLWGWSLAQAGQRERGERLMDQASLRALGDGAKRYALVATMRRLGHDARARHEVNRLVRTAELDSREVNRCLRSWPDEIDGAPDKATLLERSRLLCLRQSTAFVKVRYYLTSAVAVHAARAQAHVAAGRWKAAVGEADECLRLMPGNTDAGIDIVTALDARGRRGEAEGLFARYHERSRKLCAAYPQSGAFHNRTAWLAARCKRELDAALDHARRAVRLAPEAHAHLDTLAEVHFVRGDVDRAVELMEKCLQAAPRHGWYRKQIERFRAAQEAARRGGGQGER